MPKPSKETPKKKQDDDSDNESDDETFGDSNDSDEVKLKPFDLGQSAKLAGFSFIAFILLMSDVFVLRVMDRPGYDLVSARAPTKKGLVCIGFLLAMSMIVLDFLIVKEKL